MSHSGKEEYRYLTRTWVLALSSISCVYTRILDGHSPNVRRKESRGSAVESALLAAHQKFHHN